MQFYKIEGYVNGATKERLADTHCDEYMEWVTNIRELTEEMNGRLGKEEKVFLARTYHSGAILGAIAESRERVEEVVKEYLARTELEIVHPSYDEVVFHDFNRLLNTADRNGFIRDADDALSDMGLSVLRQSERFGLDFGENLLEVQDRKKCEKKARELLMDGSFLPEIARIFASADKGEAKGHPVHYTLRTDDKDVRRESYRILLSSLYAAGRIRNRRYIFCDIHPERHFSLAGLERCYKSAEGGAVILRYCPEDDADEEEYASEERDTIEDLAGIINPFRHQVLTVLCFPRECTKAKALFGEHLSRISFVELEEDLVEGERAKDYLKGLCREKKVRADKKLFAGLEDGKTYLSADLREIFNNWFDRKLKTDVYPEYRLFAAEKEKIVKEKPKGSAYGELMEMIGLSQAKSVIQEALDYFKARKVFADKGMTGEQPSMHMVFTGNPGSAKTTVARLFARIMRENGVLSKGHLVECGRGDLVGKFVGWTAPTIQKKFKEAVGGVLFIDEAYSLVDDRSGSFGDEAINTIVQEMENHRSDCVVIFAGYPEEMEKFLQKNPGLRSRISFHVPFEDYSTEELLGIAELLSGKKGLNLTVGARKKLGEIFDEARTENDFGNGRFVRNILEQAKMRQASRLVKMDLEKVTEKDVATITEEDIRLPMAGKKDTERKVIGFSA